MKNDKKTFNIPKQDEAPIDTNNFLKVPIPLTEKEYIEYSKINKDIIHKIIGSTLYSTNFDMTNVPGICTQIFVNL